MHIRTPEERFWAKVKKTTPEKCWNWTAAKFWCGYGAFVYNGKQWYAHRLSYALTTGEIPKGIHVCHTCDNRICCNPSHLFLGTNSDNMADKVQKGRQAKGEKHGDTIRPKTPRGIIHPKAKLTEKEIIEIRAMYRPRTRGLGPRTLGKQYGVSSQNIQDIIARKTWTHI